MFFRDHALNTPDRVAVLMASSGQSITYRELEDRSNQLANLLRDLGLRRGDHVAILMENNLAFFEAIAAASRCGLYYTPISAHLRAAEVAYIIDDCRARIVIVTPKLADLAREAAVECPSVEHWFVTGSTAPAATVLESYEVALGVQPTSPLDSEQLGMAMMYSSGTTGRPKGIVRPLPDGDPEHSEDAVRLGRGLMKLRAGMTLLIPAPLYHAAPHAAAAAGLQLGSTTVVMDKFEPLSMLELIEQHRVTHVQVVPTMFVRLLKLPEQQRRVHDLSSLEAVVHSAAPCPVHIKEQMISWLGPIIFEYYGATESYGFTRCTSEQWLAHKGTVGRAVLGEIHILDDDGVEVSTGEIGNVFFVGGSSFTYLGAESEAAEPPGASVGDVGYVDDEGYLYLTDRRNFMIVSGGVNIYPQEVEDVLLACVEVDDAAVIGVPDEDFGEAVKAVVVLAPEFAGTPEIENLLIARCRASIASFKCPRSVDVVESLPRLESGKLAKHRLREQYVSAGATPVNR